jgi:hypothetical protein
MRSRAIPAYTGKTLQERMVSAGYAIAAKPMEEGGDTWKIVIATGNRGTCGGSVQYYDYAGDPKSADTLVASLKELHGDKYPIHRVNDRVLLVAIVKEGQMERSACADEMLDVLTR